MNSIAQAGLRRSQQMSAALTIAQLCKEPLPAVHQWKITKDGIVGQLLATGAVAVTALGEWSEFLGGVLPRVTDCVEDRSHIAVEADYRGSRLKMWTAMDAGDVPSTWTVLA